ncbi:Uncharacterised protein [Mycobacteroides abscessus subsp. abscessus]|nr:Uncharacterised protein [Mycobacteroides abscessus subsp. abscessus]
MLIAMASLMVAAVSGTVRADSTSTEKIGALVATPVSSLKISRLATCAQPGSSFIPPSRWGRRLEGALGSAAFSAHSSCRCWGTGPR